MPKNMGASAERRQSPKVEVGLLKNTGFNAELSVTSLVKKYHNNLARGMNPEEAIRQPLIETEGDIKGYGLEYIMRESWLPNPMHVREYKGRKRLFNKFSNLPISEGIDRRERQGAVAEALEFIEPAILEAPNNTIAMMMSDGGESGMPNQAKAGKTINYPDAQLYFFIKDKDGNYQANTLVMDPLEKAQYERFFASMGYIHRDWAKDGLSDYDRASAMVRDVIFMPATEFTPESIVRRIQKIKGSNSLRTLKGGGERTFDDVYRKMKKGNALLDVDNKYQAQLDALKKFIDTNKDSIDLEFTQKRIQQELEKTVLNIQIIIEGGDPIEVTGKRPLRKVFKRQIKALEASGGCNGGGGDIMVGPLGLRRVSSTEASEYTTGKCIKCDESGVKIGVCTRKCKECE